jgi:hypothetical protein
VELLASKMHSNEFVIPPYQRDDTWEPARKSRFIESLLMGLPIPFLFFWESPATGKLEIVDGSQRLRTIDQFVLGDLVLGELDTLSELQGLRFQDLPESRQRKVKNRSIRGIVLSEHADEQARFDLFDRINTGSKIANKAEVRRGALAGPFLDLVIELSKEHGFERLAPVPEKDRKLREREELVTRFFAFGDGLDGYKDRVSPFLFDFAKKMNAHFAAHPEDIQTYRERFLSTMAFVRRTFPHGFRRAGKGIATPLRLTKTVSGGGLRRFREPRFRSRLVSRSGLLRGLPAAQPRQRSGCIIPSQPASVGTISVTHAARTASRPSISRTSSAPGWMSAAPAIRSRESAT